MTSDRQSITLKVGGMNCGHCVMHVTKGLTTLDEVAEVMVTLEAGDTSDVLVTLNDDITDEKLAKAIDEAGYVLVGVERT